MKGIEFKNALISARNSLKKEGFILSTDNLGYAIGLSRQHLHNLERIRENDETGRNYSLSYEKLKDVILFLSLSELSDEHIKYIKDKKAEKKKDSAGYFQKYGYPKVGDLDLKKLRKLLFTAVDIENYMDSFIPTGRISNSRNEITEFLNYAKDEHSIPVIKQNISQIQHDYHVWSLSDFLGESKFERSIFETANNIARYKIKYVNFVPLRENLNWRVATRNIEEQINKIKQRDKTLEEYWKTDKWENYWNIYGISEISFLIRFRIYNALSSTARGNYNVGGTTEENIELVNILPDELSSIKRKLKTVLDVDTALGLSEKPFFSEDIQTTLNKKFPL